MAHRVQQRCDEYDVLGAVPRDLSVIKRFIKRDCAMKRLIDIEEDFLQACIEQGVNPNGPRARDKQITSRSKEEEKPKKVPFDPCASTSPKGGDGKDLCDPCRQLNTSVILEELTKPGTINEAYKDALPPYFDEETVLGNAMPVKFRFRRRANKCDLERTTNLMCTPTETTNVIILTNTADVMVWPSQRVAQMNRVPVTMISGKGDLTEYMLEEETIM